MASDRVVFLFDVDNTLIDNDAIQQDLKDHLQQNYGRDARDVAAFRTRHRLRHRPRRLTRNPPSNARRRARAIRTDGSAVSS